jgi:L-rhamnose isomerase
MAERTWGLHALARSGEVALDLDESTDDRPRTYMLTLAVPGVELRFEIASADASRRLSAFMGDNYGRKASAELQIGLLDGLPVRIIKDDEHADRFFIVAARDGMIHLTLVDPVSGQLLSATKELAAEAAAR